MRERQSQTNRVERVAHPAPNLLAGQPQVLATERDVVADPGQDDLRVRILEHETDVAPGLLWPPAAHEQFAAGLAIVVPAEHPGERLNESRFARAGRAEKQNTLPRPDLQIEIADRPGQPSGMTPPPAASGDRGRERRQVGGQTRTAEPRPEAKRFSAPVLARPLTTNAESSPASTMPETIELTR